MPVRQGPKAAEYMITSSKIDLLLRHLPKGFAGTVPMQDDLYFICVSDHEPPMYSVFTSQLDNVVIGSPLDCTVDALASRFERKEQNL